MKVVILCGGKGIRAFPFTEYLPKPMLPVMGSPILVQIIRNFISQGFNEFILAAGYRRSAIEDYFDGKNLGAKITILDTGDETDTGGRILACKAHLGDTFMATYGDGLSDVPLKKLVAFHNNHKALLTVTSVPLISQYGILDSNEDGKVTALREKPIMKEHWINAGFFVMNKKIFDNWTGTNLEREVIPQLVTQGQVYTYRHPGFFKSMDSYKDQQEFDDLVREGRVPWQVTEQ